MARGINKVILVGNLGKEPEIKLLEGNVKLARFSLATSEVYKDRNTNEERTITEWHNIVLWRGLAEIAERYLHKGSQVYIEGKIKTRSWEDENKVTRYATEIVADNINLLGGTSRNESPDSANASANASQQSAADPTERYMAPNNSADDDLPF